MNSAKEEPPIHPCGVEEKSSLKKVRKGQKMSKLKKIALETGGWFSPKNADIYAEETWWDGSNHVSFATGEVSRHQALYHTKKGAWILHSWSSLANENDLYVRITPKEATVWLILNKHHTPHEVEEIALGMEL